MTDQHLDHSPNPEPPIVGTAIDVIHQELRRSGPLAIRRRRLLRALHDLGLLPLLGPGWVTVSDDGQHWEFGALDDRTADRLVHRLEEIAAGRADSVPTPGPGQLGFDFDRVTGPSSLAGSSHHLENVR